MNQFSVIDSITREASFVKGGKPGFVFVVCAKDDVDATMCGKGLKVEVLTFDGGLVVGKRLDVRRKVFDGYNRVSLRRFPASMYIFVFIKGRSRILRTETLFRFG